MRKVMPIIGATVSALAMAWCGPVLAQDQKKFQDVPDTHWAYQAVTDLQQKGILIGYPDGFFRGKRTLTRYEFAVALQRALSSLPPPGAGQVGPQGPPGPTGDVGPAGPPGMTPEEVDNLRKLTDEFKNELASLGTNVRDINNRLDALAKDVADIKDRLNRMIMFTGDFMTGFRSDRSRYGFLDYSGATRGANNSIFENVDAVHDFHLKAAANLPGGVKFVGDLFASNYLDYRNDGFSLVGNPPVANKSPLDEHVGVYQAELDIPIGSFGSNTMLTLGRFKNQVTPLTYWRPDTDAYFDLPWYDDGNFVEDGFKLSSKFGSATSSLWAGSYNNLTTAVTGAGAVSLNTPFVGGLAGGSPRSLSNAKPIGLDYVVNGGAVAAAQSAGVHVGLPLFHLGELGVTLADFSAEGGANPTFGNVVLYGVNFKAHDIGRFHISAEGAKTVTQKDVSTGDGQDNEDNNAYILNVGYHSGPVHAEAGYQYIDPRFGAPGYWNKIGNWYDPTNVRGPFVRVGYHFSHSLQGYLGGDFLEGARNRPGLGAGFGNGLLIDDNITRASAGVKWNLSHMVNIRADYEGVFWDLSAASSNSGVASKPIEQYLTIGAGLNLASNTVLKLAYQIISVRDVGGGFGGYAGSPDGISNASVFTTQVAVHF